MRRPWIALALLLVVGAGVAQPVVVLTTPSAVSLQTFAPTSMPVRLSAGPDGGTTLGANQTSSQSSVTGGVVAAQTHHVATATSTLAASHRIRLRLVSATGGTADCTECTVQLRQGGTTSAQVSYVNGALSGSGTGPWISVGAAGSGSEAWSLYTVSRAKVVVDATATFTYALDIVPSTTESPRVEYGNVRVVFQV